MHHKIKNIQKKTFLEHSAKVCLMILESISVDLSYIEYSVHIWLFEKTLVQKRNQKATFGSGQKVLRNISELNIYLLYYILTYVPKGLKKEGNINLEVKMGCIYQGFIIWPTNDSNI